MRISNYLILHENTNTPSVGNEYLIDVSDAPDVICVEIAGDATTILIKFEVLVRNGGQWSSISGIKIDDFLLSTTTVNLNEVWLFDISPFYKFRANVVNIEGGSVSIYSKITKT